MTSTPITSNRATVIPEGLTEAQWLTATNTRFKRVHIFAPTNDPNLFIVMEPVSHKIVAHCALEDIPMWLNTPVPPRHQTMKEKPKLKPKAGAKDKLSLSISLDGLDLG